jgi:hypothetical protein
MGRMGKGEREPIADRHGVQFIGTICQQEQPRGTPEMD